MGPRVFSGVVAASGVQSAWVPGAAACAGCWGAVGRGAGQSSAPFLEGEQRKGSKLRGEVTGDTEHSHPTQLEEASGQGRFSEGHGLELEPEGGVDHRQAKGDRQRVPGGGERVGEGLGGAETVAVWGGADGGARAAQTGRGLVPAGAAPGLARFPVAPCWSLRIHSLLCPTVSPLIANANA